MNYKENILKDFKARGILVLLANIDNRDLILLVGDSEFRKVF